MTRELEFNKNTRFPTFQSDLNEKVAKLREQVLENTNHINQLLGMDRSVAKFVPVVAAETPSPVKLAKQLNSP